jgi:hypothetical protein
MKMKLRQQHYFERTIRRNYFALESGKWVEHN